MNIVFFVHAGFLDSQSMPRFARMLDEGMRDRGHTTTTWSPTPRFFRLPFPRSIKKWLGYVDQFLVFPSEVKRLIRQHKNDTIFVFTDNALGPWVPLVANLPHVVHCHDFLAQRSGLGEIPENRSSWTGQQYQRFIRRGYSTGSNFISVSHKTREDLHHFLKRIPPRSEMVYNGLNQSFVQQDPVASRKQLSQLFNLPLENGFLLHVGGNQWYKNRRGVIELYDAWRKTTELQLPLLLIGEAPSPEIVAAFEAADFKKDIHFLPGVEDKIVRTAYSGATVFLFPSLAEGFGWPIAEAMAAGCPVITTNESPMTEVAGEAGFTINRRPHQESAVNAWANESAKTLENVVRLSEPDRNMAIERGLQNVKRFDSTRALDQVEKIYEEILKDYRER